MRQRKSTGNKAEKVQDRTERGGVLKVCIRIRTHALTELGMCLQPKTRAGSLKPQPFHAPAAR